MNIIETYGKEIVSIIVPFLAWFLNVYLKARSKVVWSTRHAFNFLVQEPVRDNEGNIVRNSQIVNTASVLIKNLGRESSKNVEIVFNWKPQYLNIWPVRDHQKKTDDDNRHILIFESLAPKEEINIEIFSLNADLPDVIHIRTSEHLAQRVEVMWIIPPPKWRLNLLKGFMIIGAPAAIYLLIVLVQFLVIRTPAAV